MLKKFDNSPYLGYNIKYSHNEPTDSYFFLIRHITEIIQNKRHSIQEGTSLTAIGIVCVWSHKIDKGYFETIATVKKVGELT